MFVKDTSFGMLYEYYSYNNELGEIAKTFKFNLF